MSRRPVRGRTVDVDIDGDGKVDRVAIHVALRTRASCGFFVVAALRGRSAAVMLPYTADKLAGYRAGDALRLLGEPAIVYGVSLRARNRDVVVRLSHGASWTQDALVGLVHGRLRILLRFDAGGFATQGTTSFGCGKRGEILERWSGPTRWDGHRYRGTGSFERTFQLRHGRYTSVSTREAAAKGARWLFRGYDGLQNCAVT